MRASPIVVLGPMHAGQLPESYARAFERLGRAVVRFDSDKAYLEGLPGARHRLLRRALRSWLWARMNRQVEALVAAARPALVLAIKGTFLHAPTIRRVRERLGVPIVNYYADNPFCGVPLNPRKSSTQRRDLIRCLREYSRVWIWERGMARRLAEKGVPAAYLPFGVDPEVSRPLPPADCDECGVRHPVVFIGQHSDKRESHVAAVRRHRVALWGSRWPRAAARFAGRHLFHARGASAEKASRLYAAAVACLNIVDDLNMPGHNMRTFEVPAAGGVLVSAYTAEQAELFPEDEAAVYYRSPEELDDKLDRLVGEVDFRDRLRAAGGRIAASHSYDERARQMLAELGI